MSNVTSVLDRLQRGESKAAEELLPLVYDELRKLAAHRMAGEKPGHTLQRTVSADMKLMDETTGFNGHEPQPKKK